MIIKKKKKKKKTIERQYLTIYCKSREKDEEKEHLVLGLNRSYFHLSSFSGVFGTLPGIPVHTFPGDGVFTVMIKPVQVGSEAGIIPPGSLATLGAALRRV